MKTKGWGGGCNCNAKGETQQLCTLHTQEESRKAALKQGKRTCFHQKQAQPIPTTPNEKKLLASTLNNFSISSLRSPYFIYIYVHLKDTCATHIRHATKAQSCSGRPLLNAQDPSKGHTNIWFGSDRDNSSSHSFAPQKTSPARAPPGSH